MTKFNKENFEWFKEKKFCFKDTSGEEILTIVGWFFDDDEWLVWICYKENKEIVNRYDRHHTLEYIPE